MASSVHLATDGKQHRTIHSLRAAPRLLLPLLWSRRSDRQHRSAQRVPGAPIWAVRLWPLKRAQDQAAERVYEPRAHLQRRPNRRSLPHCPTTRKAQRMRFQRTQPPLPPHEASLPWPLAPKKGTRSIVGISSSNFGTSTTPGPMHHAQPTAWGEKRLEVPCNTPETHRASLRAA